MMITTPAIYPRRILLIALGVTPRLLTETLAAVAVKSPLELPTEIHVLTTAIGREFVERDLQGREGNILKSFCKDYRIVPGLTIPAQNIHVIARPDGSLIDDIRTPKDNDDAADFIVSLIRGFCADASCSLHISIAGGRRNMGLLMGTALGFFGRDQDRISHVLASEAFEKGADPYPSREQLSAVPETLSLGEIPFLRLRSLMPEPVLQGGYSYTEIIEASQQEVNPTAKVSLVHYRTKWKILLGESIIGLEPKHRALYAWLALRVKNGRPTVFNSSQAASLYLLRRQYTAVLAMFQTPGTQDKSFTSVIGLSSMRVREVEEKLRGTSFLKLFDWYQAFKDNLTEEERSSLINAGLHFVSKLSNTKTLVNEKVEQAFKSSIPDITMRRIDIYKISGTDAGDSTEYSLSVRPENLSIPAEFNHILKADPRLGIADWHSV